MRTTPFGVPRRWTQAVPRRTVHVTLLALVLALALAAAFRLYGMPWVEFKYDEATALEIAADIRSGRSFPSTGIATSIGFPNPPFFVYLLVVPLLVSPAPEVATGFIGLLNVGAVLATAWLTRTFFGREVGAIAALLYATAPWAVLYARKLWANDALPFFLVLSIALLWHATLRDRPRLLVPSLGLFALATQLHLSAAALAPLWALALAAPGRRWRRLLFSVVGALLAAALYVPYLRWQAEHGWPALRRPSPGLGGDAWSWDALWQIVLLASGQPFNALVDFGALAWAVPLWDEVPRRLLLVGLVFGVVRLVWAVVRDPARRWPALLLLAWLALPVLTALRPSLPLFPHYFVAALPALSMAVAVGLSPPGWGASRPLPRRALGALALAAVAAVVLAASVLAGGFLHALQNGRASADYGPPLITRRQAIAMAFEARALDEPLYVLAHHETYSVYRYLLRSEGRSLPLLDDRRLLAFPAQGPALYLITDDVTPMAQTLLKGFQAETLAVQRPTMGPQTLRVARVQPERVQRALSGPSTRRLDRSFANGMGLAAATADVVRPNPDSPRFVFLTLYWRVQDATSDAMPHVFNHLVNAEGAMLAQADGLTFTPSMFQVGDVVMTPFTIELPPTATGQATIRTGLYSLETGQRVPLAEGGEWVEIGPLDLDHPGPR